MPCHPVPSSLLVFLESSIAELCRSQDFITRPVTFPKVSQPLLAARPMPHRVLGRNFAILPGKIFYLR